MPFARVTRAMAERRAARRRPRTLTEIQAAQTQYQEDVLGAQSRLTGAQTAATEQYANLSRQYEQQLGDYRSALSAYNQRAEDYASRIDQYINTINEIERAMSVNTGRALAYQSGLAQMTGASWLTYTNQPFTEQYEVSVGDNIEYRTRTGTRPVLTGYQTIPVPATPADPGSFTEKFTMAAPTAPEALSLEQDIQVFKQESEQAKSRMEREIGERKAASMRARRRMTDRPLLSGA